MREDMREPSSESPTYTYTRETVNPNILLLLQLLITIRLGCD